MKKLLSCVALIAASLGFAISTFAADTLVARGGMTNSYYPDYVMPGCQWDLRTYASYGGSLKTQTLICSGAGVAFYEYYNDPLSVPVTTVGNYYGVSRDGRSAALGGSFAIYKKAATYNCKAGAIDNAVYNNLYTASMVRGNTANSNPYICGGTQDQCPLNIKAVSGGYQLWCGPLL